MYLVIKTEAFILKVHLKVLMCEFLVPPNAFSFTNHCPFLAPIPRSPLSPYPFFSVHSPHSFPGAWTAQQQHWRTLAMRRYLTQTDAHTWHRGARTYRQLPSLTHSRTECHTHVAPPSSSLFFSQPTLNVPAILTSHDSVIRLHIWAFLLRGTNFSSLPFLTASFPIRRERGKLCCYANEFNAQGPVSQLKQPMLSRQKMWFKASSQF